MALQISDQCTYVLKTTFLTFFSEVMIAHNHVCRAPPMSPTNTQVAHHNHACRAHLGMNSSRNALVAINTNRILHEKPRKVNNKLNTYPTRPEVPNEYYLSISISYTQAMSPPVITPYIDDTVSCKTAQVMKVLLDDFGFSPCEAESFVHAPVLQRAITHNHNLAIEARTFKMKFIIDTGVESEPLRDLVYGNPEFFVRIGTALRDSNRVQGILDLYFDGFHSDLERPRERTWSKLLAANPEILLIEPHRAERMLAWWRSLMNTIRWTKQEQSAYVRHALVRHPKILQASSRLLQVELKRILDENRDDWEANVMRSGIVMSKEASEAVFKLLSMDWRAQVGGAHSLLFRDEFLCDF